jgi:hypothetical protein
VATTIVATAIVVELIAAAIRIGKNLPFLFRRLQLILVRPNQPSRKPPRRDPKPDHPCRQVSHVAGEDRNREWMEPW